MTASTSFACRLATAEDAPAVADLIVAAWQRAYVGLVPTEFLQNLPSEPIAERWRSPVSDSRSFRLVLTSNGRVVAACSGGAVCDAEENCSTAELYSINVHPTYWGQGAGIVLLDGAEHGMVQRGFLDAVLWTLADNHRAKDFYARAGWRVTGKQRTTSALTGTPLNEVCFARSLLSPFRALGPPLAKRT